MYSCSRCTVHCHSCWCTLCMSLIQAWAGSIQYRMSCTCGRWLQLLPHRSLHQHHTFGCCYKNGHWSQWPQYSRTRMMNMLWCCYTLGPCSQCQQWSRMSHQQHTMSVQYKTRCSHPSGSPHQQYSCCTHGYGTHHTPWIHVFQLRTHGTVSWFHCSGPCTHCRHQQHCSTTDIVHCSDIVALRHSVCCQCGCWSSSCIHHRILHCMSGM